jgi:hypothetical protein
VAADLLWWSARLRADGGAVAEAARALARSSGGTGLVGPAGDALAELVERVARSVTVVGRAMDQTADAMLAQARCG